jgi:hypothetical protein
VPHPDLTAAGLLVALIVAFALGVVVGRLDRIGVLRIWD